MTKLKMAKNIIACNGDCTRAKLIYQFFSCYECPIQSECACLLRFKITHGQSEVARMKMAKTYIEDNNS